MFAQLRVARGLLDRAVMNNSVSKRVAGAAALAWVAMVGCKSKDDDKAAGASAAKPNEPTGGDAELPDELAGWMPKDASQLWQGAWSTRLTLRTSGSMSMAGDPAAIEVHGDKATVWDGVAEHAVGFAMRGPCSADFAVTRTEGAAVMTSHHEKRFAVRGGALEVGGDGAVGYRRGKTAVACAVDGVYVVDASGACKLWSLSLGKWAGKPATCEWKTADGKDVLSVGRDKSWTTDLVADGDALASDQFRDEVKLTTRAKDYAEAKAKVSAPAK